MTVDDLITELSKYDRSLTVYVPGTDGRAEIVACVGPMEHCLCADTDLGVSIPHDVYIMSQEFADTIEDDDMEDNL